MEEENWCTPDITNSVLEQLHQDSWTSVERLHGDQEASDRGGTEETRDPGPGAEKEQLRPNEGPQSQEEVESEWEQIIWPVRSITRTSPQLSIATVQWDSADAAAETPPLLTDGASANGRNCTEDARVTFLGSTSPSLYQPEHGSAELFKQEDAEEGEGFDSRLLASALQWTGHFCEPCDAAEVQEQPVQEKEDSRRDLLDSDIGLPLSPDSEEEEDRSGTSDPLQTEDFIDSAGEIRSSEDEEGSFVHLKLEEEQEELCVLLTGQQDSEEEQISTNSVQIKEENDEDEEVEEDQSVIYDFCSEESQATETIECQRDPEAPADPQQTEDSELTVAKEKLRELLQSELSGENLSSNSEDDLTVLTHRSEMREEVDPNLDLQQSEDNSEETSTQGEENAEKLENSQQISEKTDNLVGASFLEGEDCDQTIVQDSEDSQGTRSSEEDTTEKPGHISDEELKQTHDSDHLGESQQPEQASEMELTIAEQSVQSSQTEPTVCNEAEESGDAEQPEQTESAEQGERPPQTSVLPQPPLPEQPEQSEKTNESEVAEQLSHEAEVTQQTEQAEPNQVHKQAGDAQTVVANGEPPQHPEPRINGGEVDRGMARRLAERLFNLDGIQRADVVKHIDKDNDFSRAVGEEYLTFFDFTGQNLDHALRSFLKVVILIGETQERERVLQHFSCRFHQCNPDSFSSSGAVLALTCALMLLNTDLHGQHVGKSMSSSKFVSNLDGMNEGENFNKDMLKSLYSSIKTEPLQWAVDEEELKNSVLLDEDAGEDALRSKANPFQVVPHDNKAAVIKQGFLLRKLHADIDGKRTPWGKRGWKTFYGVLRGMVLYLQKDDYRRDQLTNEEVVSVHHSLAERASEYTKKPNVFRLQTADWRVFLFQASSKVEMNLWIRRINLVSALHSSPPFPAAVGSQRRFCRPILPASQSAQTLERQLQSHGGMLESFKADLSYLQQNPPEGRKAKAKDLEEHRVRAEYLQHEVCRYETYMRVLEAWQGVEKTEDGVLSSEDLNLFDKAVSASSRGEEEEEEEEEEDEAVLKKSYSSPSLELEGLAPPQVVKVKRNISERRTYRRVVIPRWNKEA